MVDIRHRVAITAPLEAVYTAVATPEGIEEWWTRDGVRGSGDVGARLEFYFGDPEPAATMEVTRSDPAGTVSWHCVAGAPEWVGTDVTFELRPTDGETVVLFSHSGWREWVEFMSHCSARWAYFLFSLKAYVETGKGTPFPDDLRF